MEKIAFTIAAAGNPAQLALPFEGADPLDAATAPRDANADAGPAEAAVAPDNRTNLEPPGVDPIILDSLHEQLKAAMKPGNVLEELFVGEIARSTVFADYLWDGTMAAAACLEEEVARTLPDVEPARGKASRLSRAQRVRGQILIAHHATLAKLLHMNGIAQNIRNAAVTLFDMRRLAALNAALDLVKDAVDG